ncbi:hypothetical protein R5R35_008799 [Gryllus longicercus]|uniref:Uncharacterized protein n=1 Tax=Gryllus longicercus TaxID=2509291 RepID=A0AAN9WBP3_9ORTH
MEDIANGCITSTEQEGNPIAELGAAVDSCGSNGNVPTEKEEEVDGEEEQKEEEEERDEIGEEKVTSGMNESMTQSVMSLEEISSKVVVCKEPSTSVNLPVLEEVSPNNNQQPLPTENGVSQP